MKKVITALFIAALVSVHGFALEFILTPTIGYSNLGFLGTATYGEIVPSETLQTSMNTNMMPIGLAIGTVAKNGFTFMWNNDISPIGSGNANVNGLELDTKFKKGVSFQQSLILGYTFKLLDEKLYVNVGSGFAAGIAKIHLYKGIYKNDILDFNIGIPIQVGAQYFFTKNIGINVILSDVIGGCFGFANSASGGAHVGFENVFTAKLGPVFKF